MRNFTSPCGVPLHPEHVRSQLRAFLKSLNLPVRKFHTLRHTMATLLLGSGGALQDVSKALGHPGNQITSHYAHFVPEIAAAG